MYKLYTFAKSSTAWRARIALNLKKIDVQYVYLNLFKGQHRTDAYRKVNPNLGVPTLVLPNGHKLIESMAIIQYLNQVHQEPKNLFPGDAVQRAHIRGFCQVINSGIHPYQNLKLLEKIEKDYGGSRKQWATHWLKQGLQTMDQMIRQHSKASTYVFGEHLTCADVFLFPQVYNARIRYGIDITAYPNVSRVFGNLEMMKQFIDAAPKNQKDYEE